jgi:hypothetical protein
MTTTALLGITHLVAGQASAEAAINQALNVLDASINLVVINATTTAPPGSESNGDRYIVAATATGAFAGHENDIAVYIDGYVFLTPAVGWSAYDQSTGVELLWNGTAWAGRYQVDYAVTASTTHTQGGATLLTATLNYIDTITANNDAVKLPPAFNGARCLIFNPSGYSVAVWPSSGDKINALAVDVAATLGTTRGITFHGFAGHWCQM